MISSSLRWKLVRTCGAAIFDNDNVKTLIRQAAHGRGDALVGEDATADYSFDTEIGEREAKVRAGQRAVGRLYHDDRRLLRSTRTRASRAHPQRALRMWCWPCDYSASRRTGRSRDVRASRQSDGPAGTFARRRSRRSGSAPNTFATRAIERSRRSGLLRDLLLRRRVQGRLHVDGRLALQQGGQ